MLYRDPNFLEHALKEVGEFRGWDFPFKQVFVLGWQTTTMKWTCLVILHTFGSL